MKHRINIKAASRGAASIRLTGNIGGGQQKNVTRDAVNKFAKCMRTYAESGDLDIYEEIDPYFGIDLPTFERDLQALGEVDTIDLWINSPGGSVFDGFAMYSILQRHPARINVHVIGVAASIASVIAMTGDNIEMDSHSRLMIHNPWALAMGGAGELRELADMLDSLGEDIARIYSRRTGGSISAIKSMMEAETWMTASEAKREGFADTIFDADARGDNTPANAVARVLARLEADEAAIKAQRTSPAAVAARLKELAAHDRQFRATTVRGHKR